MDSNIAEFYKNKTIFLTGGTGFLGSLIIEKLLRTTEVKQIYMLVRPKRGVEIVNRISALKENLAYSVLLKQNANCFDRVVPIAGDCGLPNLGMSEADIKRLTAEAQIVLHSAATVNFDEPLNSALKINTRATRIMLQFAKKMPRLESFVYVSTAYSNSILSHIDESFHPGLLTSTVDQVLTLTELLSDELVDNMSPALCGKFPNTYTYTKALAEQLVQMESEGLPICVFRPGMILPAYKEPLDGWIANLYGPIAFMYGCAMGVMRVVKVDRKVRCNCVPVDYCVNLSLAAAWKTSVEKGITKAPIDPPIYNYVPTQENSFLWDKLLSIPAKQRFNIPLEKMMWFPYLLATNNYWIYNLAIIIYHHLPGFIIDTVLRLKGKRPQMAKIYKKIHYALERTIFFGTRNWTFEMSNSKRLYQCMSPQDRSLFEFNMQILDWNDYCDIAIHGLRKYMAKESIETAVRGRKLVKRFFIYNLVAHFIGISIFAGIVYLIVRPFLSFFANAI